MRRQIDIKFHMYIITISVGYHTFHLQGHIECELINFLTTLRHCNQIIKDDITQSTNN